MYIKNTILFFKKKKFPSVDWCNAALIHTVTLLLSYRMAAAEIQCVPLFYILYEYIHKQTGVGVGLQA